MRFKTTVVTFILLIMLLIINLATASDLYMPVNIQDAYYAKTRAFDGQPGSQYWQNRADYSIQISFTPETRTINAEETIYYVNNSPDTLRELYFHLFPDYFKKGLARDYDINPEDAGPGVNVKELVIDDYSYDGNSNNILVQRIHTLMKVKLVRDLSPGMTTDIKLKWDYRLNESSHMRTGTVDSSSFFVSYFFPRVAVYDDIDGWNKFFYRGTAEFYNDFGDFNVSVTVPNDYIVWATGQLQNPEQVLQNKYLSRYLEAQQSDEIIHIIDSTEYNSRRITRQNGRNVWKFKAQQVSDFAFATSDHYRWDAISYIVDDASGRRVFINAAYDNNSHDFRHVALIARDAIAFMCHKVPGVPFPFPSITVFNGLSGMEYPMMVNNISKQDRDDTIKLTSHEILHSYFPFYVGTNESKYAWMDEGLTSFGDYLIFREIGSPENARFYYLTDYRNDAGKTMDTPLFVSSEYLREPPYDYNSYVKAATFFLVLREYLGEEKYAAFIQEFIQRWKFKHPTPYDLFYTLEHVTQENMQWLIQPWFFEFGYMKLHVKDIITDEYGSIILIENVGGFPIPVHLKINYANGSEEIVEKSVDLWKDGRDIAEIHVNSSTRIESVDLVDFIAR